MSYVEDRWYRTVAGPDGQPAKVATDRCNRGLRYRVRWMDGPAERSRSFRRKLDADRFVEKLDGLHCLVANCRWMATTDEPVLLCDDHRDLILARYGKAPSSTHEPKVYFARNGNRIKIGWTTNVKRRMTALSLPASCVVLLIEGGPDREDTMHRRFAASRIEGSEWFRADPVLETFIAREAAAQRKRAAVQAPPLNWEQELDVAEQEQAAGFRLHLVKQEAN